MASKCLFIENPCSCTKIHLGALKSSDACSFSSLSILNVRFAFDIFTPPHIIKCFLLKIQSFLTLSISVNKPEL